MPSAVTPPPTPLKAGIEIAIDRGGTFTDCIATNIPGKQDIVVKLLSVDPSNYDDAPTVSLIGIFMRSVAHRRVGRHQENLRAGNGRKIDSRRTY
jgi:hypothetical protein